METGVNPAIRQDAFFFFLPDQTQNRNSGCHCKQEGQKLSGCEAFCVLSNEGVWRLNKGRFGSRSPPDWRENSSPVGETGVNDGSHT